MKIKTEIRGMKERMELKKEGKRRGKTREGNGRMKERLE